MIRIATLLLALVAASPAAAQMTSEEKVAKLTEAFDICWANMPNMRSVEKNLAEAGWRKDGIFGRGAYIFSYQTRRLVSVVSIDQGDRFCHFILNKADQETHVRLAESWAKRAFGGRASASFDTGGENVAVWTGESRTGRRAIIVNKWWRVDVSFSGAPITLVQPEDQRP